MQCPVLILMDYQEAVCREDGPVGRQGTGAQVKSHQTLQRASTALDWFRRQSLPVVHVRVAFDPSYDRLSSSSPRFAAMRDRRLMLADDPWAQICPEVAPGVGEPLVEKGCVNPFVGTNLTSILTRLGAHDLVLGGVATNHVVESTARFAADVGYPVTVLEDACAAFSEAQHRFAVETTLPMYASVLTVEQFIQDLEKA